ncbi:hypothetical protein RRG08_015228 [Elysia crispata]|uniref:LicD/FKTN/FKRP nucleotidyltransferase domain-containing protein n=1 Tax=Elysia crispata TaxID=231223 RepID=A0AAE1DV38_9GAST|nr:hypothetical protein RRG08_015228 [Elysia crispata]
MAMQWKNSKKDFVPLARARSSQLRMFWTKHKLGARLRVLFVITAIIMFVRPLRNNLVPGWPVMFRDLSTFNIIRIYIGDVLINVDRSPYTGSCDDVHRRLAKVRMPKLEEMHYYDLKEWYSRSAALKSSLSKEDLEVLDDFKPSLTPLEQQQLLFSMLSTTQALAAFNISYYISEGSLIGYWRHHGLIPWDDDVDVLFDARQWPLVKKVMSCIPGIELYMGWDRMWKVYPSSAALWKGEKQIRFPFVDLFMFNYDKGHVWPVCMWMKTDAMMPRQWILPTAQGIFEGYPVAIPRQPHKNLNFHYGDVDSGCYSRIFLRRERMLVPVIDRTHMPCKPLKKIYPFVQRNKPDPKTGVVTEELIEAQRVLSVFNATYHHQHQVEGKESLNHHR